MAGFVIDGREYDVPTLETFNMGEAMVLEEYSGLTLNQFAGDDAVMSAGVVAALMHVAYSRKNPHIKKADVRALIEGSNLADALEALSEEEDADPPTETTNGNGQSLSTGGRSSPATSAGLRADALSHIGTPL